MLNNLPTKTKNYKHSMDACIVKTKHKSLNSFKLVSGLLKDLLVILN